jgi:hypothetical protein
LTLPIGWGIVLIAGSLFLAAMLLGLDTYSLLSDLKEGNPSRYDKIMTIATLVLLAITLGVCIGLTFYLALPLLPLLITGGRGYYSRWNGLRWFLAL